MKELIGVSYSGLADRIMMLLAGRKLARDVGAKFTFIWPVNDSCGAKFEDVLRVKPDGDRFSINIEDEEYSHGAPFLHAHDMPWRSVVEFIKGFKDSDTLKLCAYPKEFDMDDFGKVIDFNFEVQDKASEIALNHFDDATIGVHIRARDLADTTPNIKEYVYVVSSLHTRRNGMVFLATDCPIVRKWFLSLFPGAIHLMPKTFDRSKREAIVDAAIELALLRKCKRLVLSGYSGFSRMACHTCQAPSEGVLIVDRT